MIIAPSSRLDSVTTYYFAKKLKQLRILSDAGIEIINLGIGSPDLLPHDKILESLHRASKLSDANKYQSYNGLPELRSAISNWYTRWFDVSLNADNEILPLIGSKEGIMHISMSFLESGDQVLVPNPGYPSYSSASKLAGAEVVSYDLIPENNWKPDLEKLEKLDLTNVKIMWLNYPNMPTGADGNLGFFSQLIRFALKYKILLCHDNPYTFILNDQPKSIFQIDGAKECCLELMSMSKNYNMAGWRVGACIAHKEVINTILKFKSNMDSGMYKGIQLATVTALELDQPWFDQINEVYRKRREIVFTIMSLLQCQFESTQVGMFVWAKIPPHYSNAESLSDQILDAVGVFITPGHIFGSNGQSYIRISLCSPMELLEKARYKIESYIASK